MKLQNLKYIQVRLSRNCFVQDFHNRKVISGIWVHFSWFTEHGFDFKNIFLLSRVEDVCAYEGGCVSCAS